MNLKKCTSMILSVVIALGVIMIKPSTSEATTERVLAGSNRHKTAIEVSKKGWNSSENVLLVNDSAIADALAATPLAEELNAPILLTGKYNLNKDTKREIERLGAKNVYLIGGESVLTNNLLKEISGTSYRIAGNSREETAVQIAEKINEIKPVKTIAVVNGKTGLADAVSIASVAAERDMAIILSNTKAGVKESGDFIKSAGVNKSYVIGGTKAVSSSVENSLPNVTRISGSNRSVTNAKVIEKFYPSENLNNIYVAKNGSRDENQLIDALAVGVLAAKNNSPVLIVSKDLAYEQAYLLIDKNINIITRVGGNGNERAFVGLKRLQSNLNLPYEYRGIYYDKYQDESDYGVNSFYTYSEFFTVDDKYIKWEEDGKPIIYKVTKNNGNTYYIDAYEKNRYFEGIRREKWVLENNMVKRYDYENGKYSYFKTLYVNIGLPDWQKRNYYRDDNICMTIDDDNITIFGKVYNYKVVAINERDYNRSVIKVNDYGETIYLELHAWGNKISISYKYENEYNNYNSKWHLITTFATNYVPGDILGEIENILPGMDPDFSINN